MSLAGLFIGRLDARLVIQQKTTTRDSIGADVDTWTEYKQTHAQRMRKPGREIMEASQQVAIQPTEYKVRYDVGITPLMRLYERENPAQLYYIRDVQHWRREGYTLITAERRDNE